MTTWNKSFLRKINDSKRFLNNIELMYTYDGLTREEFAEKAGISETTLIHAQRGYATRKTKDKIVTALNSTYGNVFPMEM